MIEVKKIFMISQKDAKKIQRKLRELGAWPQKQIETVSVFDDTDFSFLKQGKTLRKRLIHLKNSRIGDLLFVNSASLDFEDSLEHDETSIELADFRDSPNLLFLLLKQGYKPVLIYGKERESWLGLGLKFGADVFVDELAELGCFLEIRGGEEKITEMTRILGLARKKSIKKTTYQLYGDFLRKRGKSFDETCNFTLKNN